MSSQDLPPCPLCGGPGDQNSADCVACPDPSCLLSAGVVTFRCWNALPRSPGLTGEDAQFLEALSVGCWGIEERDCERLRTLAARAQQGEG